MPTIDRTLLALGVALLLLVLGLGWTVAKRRSLRLQRVQPADFAGPHRPGLRPGANVIYFTTPYCEPCIATEALLARLKDDGVAFTLLPVNLAHRADLANRYGVVTAPTLFVADATGRVHAGWTDTPPEHELRRAIRRVPLLAA